MANGLLNNLVAYYKLDAAGLTADSQGSATLTNNNSVTTTTGKINEAASLNGSNQNLGSGAAALNLAGPLSMSFWFQTTSVASGAKCLSCNMRLLGGNGYWVVEVNRTAGKITVLSHDQNTIPVTTATALSANTWYHVVVVLSGSAGGWTWTVYLNGASDGTGGDTSNAVGTGASFVLGAYDNNSANLHGLLDEYGLWSRALSGTDVTALYNGGSGLAFASFDSGAAAAVANLLPLLGVG